MRKIDVCQNCNGRHLKHYNELTDMKQKQIAEAFSNGNFEFDYLYLADNKIILYSGLKLNLEGKTTEPTLLNFYNTRMTLFPSKFDF
jgi:hypothetical protein